MSERKRQAARMVEVLCHGADLIEDFSNDEAFMGAVASNLGKLINLAAAHEERLAEERKARQAVTDKSTHVKSRRKSVDDEIATWRGATR